MVPHRLPGRRAGAWVQGLLVAALALGTSNASAEPPIAVPAPPPAPLAGGATAATTTFPGQPIAPLVPPMASPERAPEPSSGLLLLLAGAGLGVAGVADLATAPLCRLSSIRSSAQPACIGTSVGVGLALVGGSIPLLVYGVRQRAAWTSWKAGVTPLPGGAGLSFAWRF